VADSWNNISKYIKVKNAFFIFDEQRLVGSGTWVKSFLKIIKNNNWILLSATPGDTWSDYIPVFIANGFYKNRTEFINRHIVYSYFTKFPMIDRYIETSRLERLRKEITVNMVYNNLINKHDETIMCQYDKKIFDQVVSKRWNIFKNKPIKQVSELCYIMRRIVNSDSSRLKAIEDVFSKHKKLIIFYNFDYELELLRSLCFKLKASFAEWNGHNHQDIPKTTTWIYLVQYSAGAEGWNCIDTNTILFYSQNYSYKTIVQAAGRIDRLNTPFKDLYYYHLRSNSSIDLAILNAIKKKKIFNMNTFIKELASREKHML